jgi:hypothetical protein
MGLIKDKHSLVRRVLLCLGLVLSGSVVARSIHASGLDLVTAVNPVSQALAHEVNVTGVVRHGQEYAFYMDAGIRVAAAGVMEGDGFGEGDALLYLDVGDIRDMVGKEVLELEKLESALLESGQVDGREKRGDSLRLARAREDYGKTLKEGEVAVRRAEQDLRQAQDELAEYGRYVDHMWGTVSGGDSVSDGDAARDYWQEGLRRLRRSVTYCARLLEDAVIAGEDSLLMARRRMEDAGDVGDEGAASPVWDGDALRGRIDRLEALILADGIVYAKDTGYVVSLRVAAGERTTGGPCIVYAKDGDRRYVEAVLDEGEVPVGPGDSFDLTARAQNGSTVRDRVVVEYSEEVPGGTRLRMPVGDQGVCVGQSVSLRLVKMSGTYESWIPAHALHVSDMGGTYLFAAERGRGLGQGGWRVVKVPVTVLGQGGGMAAVSGTGIDGGTRVIVSSGEGLTEGEAVRVAD